MSLKMFSAFVKPAVLYSSVRQQPAVCVPKDFTEKNPHNAASNPVKPMNDSTTTPM